MSRSKETRRLRIYRQGILAGTLSRTPSGCEFQFDPSFLSSPRFERLSFAMPKTDIPYRVHGVNLHPFFAGLLPEGLRLSALAKSLKTSQDDLFSLFAESATHAIGDVYAGYEDESLSAEPARESPKPAKSEIPKLREIDFYEYFQELVSSGKSYSRGEDALAGVQEKLSASMISFPLNIARAEKSYILKLNPRDKPNLVENELYSMQLARKCGIETANCKLVRDRSGNLGLLVERFDRISNGGNEIQMLHQEDFCQVLGRYPADKYNLSLRELIEGVRPYLSAEMPSTLKLLRIYCFSYLLGNGDLHAKNLSLLTKENGLTDLSPAYDLLNTYIFGDGHMALKIDGRDQDIRRSHVLEFSVNRGGVSRAAVNQMLDRLVENFSRHHQILKQIPMPERSWVHLEKMIRVRLEDLAG